MRSRLFGSRDVPIIGIGTWQLERDDPAQATAVAHVDELAGTPTLDDAVVAELEAAFPLGPWRGLPSI